MIMLSSTYDSGPDVGGALAITVVILFYIATILFAIYLYMRIARKAGWTLWHGLLVLVPVAGLVFVIMFAFVEWPVERRLREAEARLGLTDGGTPYGGGPYGGAPYGGAPYGGAPYGDGTYPGHGAAGGYAGPVPGYGAPQPGTTGSPYDVPPTAGPVPPTAGPVPPAPEPPR